MDIHPPIFWLSTTLIQRCRLSIKGLDLSFAYCLLATSSEFALSGAFTFLGHHNCQETLDPGRKLLKRV